MVTEASSDPLQRALDDLMNPRPVRFTWEARGQPCSEDDAPDSGYISEAGTLATDCALALKKHQLAGLKPGPSPKVAPVPLRAASRAEYRELVCDVLNLLMGLPSDTFFFDRVSLLSPSKVCVFIHVTAFDASQ